MKALLFLLTAAPIFAQTPDLEFFEKNVRPIFASKCAPCHNEKMQSGGLNLVTLAGLDAVVMPKDAAGSRLFQAVSYTGRVKMPPMGKLPEAELAALREWIDMGAPRPKESAARRSRETPLNSTHWSFQPVKDYSPPSVKRESWVRTPVDRFILSKLEAKGLAPAAPASRLTLLRRVTYDLTGLPPALREIDDFLADQSPQAYAKLVDRLLASPQYGERWGRHWLDVARYADSTGMDEDHVYPYAWRYRDYVVQAFNNDLPFNRFIEEQIAGDLLPGAGRQGIIATGFLALGPKPLAQQDRIKMIYDVVDEQIDTVSKAFLGLTVSCARCHDHKFDPILTKDYYGLASIFASTKDFRNLGRPGSVSYIYYAPLDPAAYAKYQAHRWRLYGKEIEMEEAMAEDATRENTLLRPKIGAFLTAAWKVRHKGLTVAAAAEEQGLETKQLEKWVAWLKSADLKKWDEATEQNLDAVVKEYQEAYLASGKKWDDQLAGWRRRFTTEVANDRDIPERPKFGRESNPFFAAATFDGGPMELHDSPRVAQLRAELKELQQTMPPEPDMASAVCDGPIIDQHVFLRGDHLSQGEPVAKHFPLVISKEMDAHVKGSGRLELAHWLASSKNPLTARVIVNRVWQWHFGEALVRTPNNWGTTGEKPAHPELLDYLASRFVESGWSIKALHRMILLSNTYQMGTAASKATREADPGNHLWSRFNRIRMSVEEIRDTLLALGGNMDQTIGGSLLPEGEGKRSRMDPDSVRRRTLYIPVRRGSIQAVLATFDYGDATTPSEGRPRTNVAPQALFIRNSRFVVDQAMGLAKMLLADASLSDTERVQRAYLLTLTRRAEPFEVDDGLSYMQGLRQRLGKESTALQAWQSFCHVLLSTNEFLYLN
jgi:cytochrome c553